MESALINECSVLKLNKLGHEYFLVQVQMGSVCPETGCKSHKLNDAYFLAQVRLDEVSLP